VVLLLVLVAVCVIVGIRSGDEDGRSDRLGKTHVAFNRSLDKGLNSAKRRGDEEMEEREDNGEQEVDKGERF